MPRYLRAFQHRRPARVDNSNSQRPSRAAQRRRSPIRLAPFSAVDGRPVARRSAP
jgi:hypothetical protein